ncbi:hypothetical protein [Mucilaginibacter myungsuensis]|uniref:Outer membrane protein beta-barrel domain-containing protein n=1 Tax=Mucilaginibacter myungsuensis TaxID=649104 RepID=A0A929KXR8_9SPHI|nr:hypothetical protein [Mucilaginibacter myungsuensis]MBE9661883.1 hypothetical protein [Mucilaginibacter myungsuensis]MDN3599683.1 hypothetical protein [Mucilaginibacter myungsuensis]
MKTSTKFLASAVAAVAILFGTQVKAQTTSDSPWRLGIGVEGIAPVGKLHDASNIGIGGTARLQYGADKGLAYTLTSGYYNLFPKGNSGLSSAGIVPVKVGIKAYFVDKFYFGAEAGAGFETTGLNKNTKLLLSPGLGYSNHSWDVGARYENFSGQSNNYGFAALRVAYGFGL